MENAVSESTNGHSTRFTSFRYAVSTILELTRSALSYQRIFLRNRIQIFLLEVHKAIISKHFFETPKADCIQGVVVLLVEIRKNLSFLFDNSDILKLLRKSSL